MFGPSLLVAPVVEQGATTREVYLPKGRWYDWYTGEIYEGGRYVTVPAPLDKTPLFVREGSMVPTIPVVMNTQEAKHAPITLRCFPKNDHTVSYTLYEDDGISLGYTRGEFSTFTFTFAVREGKYYFEVPAHDRLKLQIPGKKPGAVYVNGKKTRFQSKNNSITILL